MGAEADPALLYSSYYGYSPYTYGYGYSPYAYSHGYYAAPSVYTVHGANSYYANSAGVVHHVVGKREAEGNPEAEAEADPAAWYGHYYGYGGYGGYRGYYGYRGYGYLSALPPVLHSNTSSHTQLFTKL